MADGTVTPAEAEWAGDIQIAGIKIHGSFLVFNRSGSWAFLFGKPLLTAFKAVHDYRDDTITIHNDNQCAVLTNRHNDPTHICIMGMQTPTLDVKQLSITSNAHQQSWWIQKTVVNAVETTKEPKDSIFTRHTDLFNPKQIEHIVNAVTLGEDLTMDEQAVAEALVVEFADVFTCSLSEVLLIPDAKVDLNISENARFNTSIRQ